MKYAAPVLFVVVSVAVLVACRGENPAGPSKDGGEVPPIPVKGNNWTQFKSVKDVKGKDGKTVKIGETWVGIKIVLTDPEKCAHCDDMMKQFSARRDKASQALAALSMLVKPSEPFPGQEFTPAELKEREKQRGEYEANERERERLNKEVKEAIDGYDHWLDERRKYYYTAD